MASFKLESLGGSWAQQKPAVAAQRIRLDIFMVGDNHQLYHYWQGQGEPFRLESLGGSFRGGVTAFSWDIHHRDVFAIGSDNQLYHYWQGPSEARFNHEVLGGNWDGTVKAVSWGPGRWDVFAVGTNFELYHYWYPRYEPTGPTFGLESLGGNHTTTWTLASIAWPGRLDVFAHGDNWGLLHYFQRAGEPFAVEKVPGRPGPGYHLDAVSWGPGRLDVFRCATRLSVTELQHFLAEPRLRCVGVGGGGLLLRQP